MRKSLVEYVDFLLRLGRVSRLPVFVRHSEFLSGNRLVCDVDILPHFEPEFNSVFIIRRILSSNVSELPSLKWTLTVYVTDPIL
jgi:hypothetical protein